ncbi:MAG: DUF2306 domain-containing protein [Polyangiales bacterium]
MSARAWTEWRAPVGLILLGLVPIAAGGARLGQLAIGAIVTAENARFFRSPVPIVLHVVAASAFVLLGALQFAPSLRRRPWHRISGRIALPAGIVAALSGLWMALFYDLPASDDALLRAFRVVAGVAMVASLVLGLVAALRRDFDAHRVWVMRGYALGIGAGTQLLTNVPWMLAVGEPRGTARAVLMGAGWGINLAVAEWFGSSARGSVRSSST